MTTSEPPLWLFTSKRKGPCFLAKVIKVEEPNPYRPHQPYIREQLVKPEVCSSCDGALTRVTWRYPFPGKTQTAYYGYHSVGGQNKKCIALAEMLQHTDMTR